MSMGVSASKSKQATSTSDYSQSLSGILGSDVTAAGANSDLGQYYGTAVKSVSGGSRVTIETPSEVWNLLGGIFQGAGNALAGSLNTTAGGIEALANIKAESMGRTYTSEEIKKMLVWGAVAVGVVLLALVYLRNRKG